MRLLTSLALALSVSSCTGVPKVDKDGMYRFIQEPFIVWAPSKCVGDMAVEETERSVDFSMGRFWSAFGKYAVQVMSIPEEVKDAATFVQASKKFAPIYMVKDRAPLGLTLTLREMKEVTINGKPGYQAISMEAGRAMFVATFVLHSRRITVTSLVFPLTPSAAVPHPQFPWNCYNRFVTSVQETG